MGVDGDIFPEDEEEGAVAVSREEEDHVDVDKDGMCSGSSRGSSTQSFAMAIAKPASAHLCSRAVSHLRYPRSSRVNMLDVELDLGLRRLRRQ